MTLDEYVKKHLIEFGSELHYLEKRVNLLEQEVLDRLDAHLSELCVLKEDIGKILLLIGKDCGCSKPNSDKKDIRETRH